MRFIFFSLRNFDKDVGESVRMYGLLNSLVSLGHEVIFISNATRYHMFQPSIMHVFINYDFKEKRSLQGSLSLLPASVVFKKYTPLFTKIKLALDEASAGNETVYFFDYLDNSIGYILKKQGLIKAYINDVHGIATIEFSNYIRNASSIVDKLTGHIKRKLADRLDKKVFEFADGLIYGSIALRDYFEATYQLKGKKRFVIPYLLDDNASNRVVNKELGQRLRHELLAPSDFVVLFVGTYKPTAGVDDLIKAFDLLYKDYPESKLILIGSGPFKEICTRLAAEVASSNRIFFIDYVPYDQLLTYQMLAHVLVCPDKQNLFSEYIVHVKYFDALISGKLVINGSFPSVTEVNPDDNLSLTFKPSNVEDLYRQLKNCRENFDSLSQKYKGAKQYTSEHFIYRTYVPQLTT